MWRGGGNRTWARMSESRVLKVPGKGHPLKFAPVVVTALTNARFRVAERTATLLTSTSLRNAT